MREFLLRVVTHKPLAQIFGPNNAQPHVRVTFLLKELTLQVSISNSLRVVCDIVDVKAGFRHLALPLPCQ